MNSAELTSRVRRTALEIGFDAVGFTRPDSSDREAYYIAWLEAGRNGTMEYLSRNRSMRLRPAEALPGCRSVICVAMSYHRGGHSEQKIHYPDGAESARPAAPSGRIAAYARGEDYHRVLRRKLSRLSEVLGAEYGEHAFRACVDTVPVIERELAARAGIGWIGKNTLVLSARLGSWLVLGELFTTLDLLPDAPASDHCGSCTRCLDACPTGAFPAAYEMDASRCISYYTIEHRGPLSPEQATGVGEWLFGCDVCQEVCPHNAKAAPGSDPALLAERVPPRMELGELRELRSGGWRRLTRDSALGRATRPMWVRNAGIVWKNLESHGSSGKSARSG